MELFDISRDHPRLSFLRLHVHLAPQVFQGDTRNPLREDLLKAEFIVCGGTVYDDA